MSTRTVLVANPSFDVYGADLQMLESVHALRRAGWDVTVAAPTDGPLRARLEDAGASTLLVESPVLRRADAGPSGVARLGLRSARALPGLRAAVRHSGADLVYVNTVTIPWWLAAARSVGVPAVCHVHEAEPGARPAVRRALTAPLLLADVVLVNSRATLSSMCEPVPRLRSRTVLVYNGVPGPPSAPTHPDLSARPLRLVSVGRISERKATLDALKTTAVLLARGLDVVVEVCGSPVPGQDDYVERVRRRADMPDLAGRVTLSGYQSPVWPALARNHLFLATSTAEPLGNAVVESQLALRPVVATAVEGHLETVLDGVTGLLCGVGAPTDMADQVLRLVDDPRGTEALATRARERAQEMFGTAAYGRAVVDVCDRLARRRGRADAPLK